MSKYPGYYIDDQGQIHDNIEVFSNKNNIICQFPSYYYNKTYICNNKASYLLEKEIPICEECLQLIDGKYNCRDDSGLYHSWDILPELSALDKELGISKD